MDKAQPKKGYVWGLYVVTVGVVAAYIPVMIVLLQGYGKVANGVPTPSPTPMPTLAPTPP